jgi:transposase
MEPIITLLLPPSYQIKGIEADGSGIVIRAAIQQKRGNCPDCGQVSTKIHGYYGRTFDDLPVTGFSVRIQLKVQRFCCDNAHCDRQTFSAAMSDFVAPYQRKSTRLISSLYHIGQALGGRAGARLTGLLSIATSRDTILRIVRSGFQAGSCKPKVIGVDDWAMRRGDKYGSIIVDLERHRVIDLLPSRSAEELSGWLENQPQIAIVSRDRSPEYRAAITATLPHATQVVDRWHLVKNLREALERSIEEIYPRSGGPNNSALPSGNAQSLRTKFVRAEPEEQQRAGRRLQRIRRYQMIQECKAQGMSIRRISRLLGWARATVRNFYMADIYPETKRKQLKASLLDPYLPYLEQRVQEGCTNATQLWREVMVQGYPGASREVSKWVSWRRRQASTDPAKSSVGSLDHTVLPSRRTLSQLLFVDAGSLDPHDAVLLKLAKQHPLLATTHDIVHGLRRMISTRQAASFDDWLSTCSDSGVPAMQRFADHLQQDRSAVVAAISSPWSNGQTEGQVNKLKMLKRQMYGRANLDLLRARILYCVNTT